MTVRAESVDELAVLLGPMMHAIAGAVGEHCEVVLHDLSGHDLDRSIHTIVNGHVTGRSVGGPSTNLGFEVLHNEEADHDAFGYTGRTADGRDLRCSSVYYRNSAGAIIAALCINIDLTPLQTARSVLDALLPARSEAPRERHDRDLTTLLDTMIDDEVARIGKPVTLMDRADRTAVLVALDARGAFELKRSMNVAAQRLGISKVTAYAYLDRARSEHGADSPAEAAS